jgi:polysaccharide biosynthesis/export protein
MALWLGACASAKGPGIGSLAQTVNATRLPPQAVIAPGDRFMLYLPDGPADGVSVLVLEDGTATFAALGTLEVAGLLVPQLRERLSARFTQVYSNGSPVLVVSERGPRQVHVLGEVATPGAIELRPDGRLTLPEAMARAGGFLKQSAWLSNTLLVRWDPVAQRQLAWKIDARPEHWDDAETIFLQPFDLIYVPNTPIDRVALWVDNYIRRLLPIPILIPTT